MRGGGIVGAVLLWLGSSCRPELGPSPALVTGTRFLAIGAEPPEVRPGAAVTLRALIASPAGEVDGAALDWAFCLAPKPVAEDNVVAAACLGAGPFEPIGTGSPVPALVPADACARFGPDVPPPQDGGAPRRPRDPDATGGYYQPVRARLGTEVAFGLVRITCGLTGATPEVAAAFRARYRPNTPPRLLGLVASGTDPLHLGATWSAGAAEGYLLYDPLLQVLGERREALRLSWFATAGSLDAAQTGAAADGTTTQSDNTWTGPGAPGAATLLWVVLRDSRGAVDWTAVSLPPPSAQR